MLTSVYLSGLLDEVKGKNVRLVAVQSPLARPGSKPRIDLIPVYCPLGPSTLFFRATKGTFVIVKGRLERNEELGLYVYSEIEEIVNLKKESEAAV